MSPNDDRGWVTPEEVAAAVHEQVDRIHDWQQLGLLGGDDGKLAADSIERARLVSFAVRRGLAAEAIARRCEHDDVIGRFVELVGPRRGPLYSLEDAANAVGLDLDTVRRLRIASGRGDEPEADDDDIEMMRGLAVALRAGMPLDALLQLARVLNDALSRVAETETRLFHFYVHERFRAAGLEGAELDEATGSVSAPLQELVEPSVLYFHRQAWKRALRDDLMLHLAEDVAVGDEVGQLPIAVVFVDLAGFTPMTEAMGDTAAATVVERFSDLVREAAAEHDGRVLKQIGDEFMLVFPSAAHAVECGTAIMAKTAAEPQFPEVRLGGHVGTALYREGDYLGTTVNVAARVADRAGRGQFLVTDAMHRELDGSVPATSAGTQSLKGVADGIELFTIDTVTEDRPLDPVCGMVIDPETCGFTLDRQGSRVFFCSETCRDRFLADPTRYGEPSP